jgi:predicted hydrolase (HD superfamily)
MLKMLSLHCHTRFGPTMHGLADALKYVWSVAGRGAACALDPRTDFKDVFTSKFRFQGKKHSFGISDSPQEAAFGSGTQTS